MVEDEKNKKSPKLSKKKTDLQIKLITYKVLIGLDKGGTLTKMCIITSKHEFQISSILSSNKMFKPFDSEPYTLYL